MKRIDCNACVDLGYVMPSASAPYYKPCPECQPQWYRRWKGDRTKAGLRNRRVNPDRVSVEPFQEAVRVRVHNGESLGNLAWIAGFRRRDGKRADVSRFQRVLGLKAYAGGASPTKYPCKTISYDKAVALCDALNLDYTDVGV